MQYVGIDYSITSPGICIFDDSKQFHPNNCKFFAFHHKPEKFNPPENVTLIQYPTELVELDRYNYLAGEVIRAIYNNCDPSTTEISLEGYSMGSSGKIFNIAENTAILKYFLYANRLPQPLIIPPTSVKKFATGKGNSKKPVMYDSFLAEGAPDFHALLTPKKKVDGSFVMDMADAYFVMKYLYTSKKSA